MQERTADGADEGVAQQKAAQLCMHVWQALTLYKCFLVEANMASSTLLSHSSGLPSVTTGLTKGRYSPSGEKTPVLS